MARFTRDKNYNANIQGWLLVKSDRICSRMNQFARTIRTQNSLITVDDFLEYEKAMEIMIAQELTYKKYEEEVEEIKTKEKEKEDETYENISIHRKSKRLENFK